MAEVRHRKRFRMVQHRSRDPFHPHPGYPQESTHDVYPIGRIGLVLHYLMVTSVMNTARVVRGSRKESCCWEDA